MSNPSAESEISTPSNWSFSHLSTRDIRLVLLSAHPELIHPRFDMGLCSEDMQELAYMTGEDPWACLQKSAETPGAHGALINGKICGIFGINDRIIWCLTDGTIGERFPLQFHKIALGVMNAVDESGLCVYNFTPSNSPNLKWLRSLGFRVFPLPKRPDIVCFARWNKKEK